jgi:hypothetical protein
MKRPCKSCGGKFPPTKDYFYGNKSRSDGLSIRCKPCDDERVNVWRKSHLAQLAETARVYYYEKRKGVKVPEEQPEQPDLFDQLKPKPAPRPATGPRCKTCGLVLYHYDIKRGECFTHAQERHIQLWNQPVRMTQAAACLPPCVLGGRPRQAASD